MSSGAIFMIVICASFPTLILVAVVVKLWEVRKAKKWPSTTGKVFNTGIKSSKTLPGEPGYNFGDSEVENEPLVEYEYEVNGQTYQNDRITIGEKTSGFELEEILNRYPVGSEVTVYYDPADPHKAVLERDLMNGKLWAGLGCLMLLFVGGPLLAVFFYYNGLEWIKPHLANPDRAPFVTALSGFGILFGLFALGFTRYVWQAGRWPTVPGRIIDAEVEAYQDWRATDRASRRRTNYKPSILYTYEVNGRRYLGDRVKLGVVVSSSSPGISARTLARYPVGREVKVYYNPTSPGEAALEPHTWVHYFPWIACAGIFLLVWAVATGRLG